MTYIDEDDCAKLGYTVTGRLPQNDMEIAVNENILNSFLVAGLYENGEKITFEIAKDFIGHKLPMPNVDDDGNKQYSGGEVLKTVVGVVNTGCSKKCRYNHINDPKHLHDKIYVHKGYKGKFHFALCKIDGGFDKLANYVFDTTFDENRFNLSEPNLGYYLVEKNLTLIKFLCLYASIIFCVTALILLTNFIGTSVRRQMKQIGILSAMGADLKCLLQIYGSSVGIICAVVYLLSVAFSAAFVAVVNSLIIKWTEAAFTVLWFSPVAYSRVARGCAFLLVARDYCAVTSHTQAIGRRRNRQRADKMRVRHLSKTYTPESGEVKALNDVNFELPESGMVFILGKSGSGKSTLLNLVSGLDRADKGSEIETCGIEIVSCYGKRTRRV